MLVTSQNPYNMGLKWPSRVCIVMRSRSKRSKMSKIGTSTNSDKLCARQTHSRNYHHALTHFRKKPVKLFREMNHNYFLKYFPPTHRSHLSIGRCGASLTCSARAGLWASGSSASPPQASLARHSKRNKSARFPAARRFPQPVG